MTSSIFRSEIPGNQASKPVQSHLTEDELLIVKEIQELRLTISEGAQAQLKLWNIQQNCAHPAFTDVEGFPYDTRFCAVCGAHMGNV